MIDIIGKKIGNKKDILIQDDDIPILKKTLFNNIYLNKNLEGKLEINILDSRNNFVNSIGNPDEFLGITDNLKNELSLLTKVQLNNLFFGSATISQNDFSFIGSYDKSFEIYEQGNKICSIIIEKSSDNNTEVMRINKGIYYKTSKKEYDQYYKLDNNNNRYLYKNSYVHYQDFNIKKGEDYNIVEYLPNHNKSKSDQKYVVIQNNEIVDMYTITNDYIKDISTKEIYDEKTFKDNLIGIKKIINVYDFSIEKDDFIWSLEFNTYEGKKETLFLGKPEDYKNSKKIEEYKKGDNWNIYFNNIKKYINTENTMRAYLTIIGEPKEEKYKEQLRKYAIKILGIDKTINNIKEYWGTNIKLYTNTEILDFSNFLELFTDGDFEFHSAYILDFEKELNNLWKTIQRYPKDFHKNIGLKNIVIIDKENPISMAEQDWPYGFNILILNGSQIKIPKIGLITNIINKLGYNIPNESKIYTSDGENTFCHEYGHIIDFKISINQEERCKITGVNSGEYYNSYRNFKKI